MGIKNFIIINLFLCLSFTKSIAQNDIINNDSAQTMLLSYRIAGGASKFFIYDHKNNPNYYNPYTYQFRDIDGYSSQLGLKLTSTGKKHTAFTMELNYLVSQFYIKYHGCECGVMYGVYTDADYKITMHSIQFAMLPKISIGKKKSFYTSFGPYINAPFYATKKGEIAISGRSFIYSYEKYYDNHIKTPFRAEFGGIFNMGTNYKLKKNMLYIELRFQSSIIGGLKNYAVPTNSILLAAIYTLSCKPLHIPFWSN